MPPRPLPGPRPGRGGLAAALRPYFTLIHLKNMKLSARW